MIIIAEAYMDVKQTKSYHLMKFMYPEDEYYYDSLNDTDFIRCKKKSQNLG